MPNNDISIVAFLSEAWLIVKNITTWVFLALVGLITWFFREKNSQHNKMYEFFLENESTPKTLEEMSMKLNKVESDSKGYWKEHKIQMESNQGIILEKLEGYGNTQNVINKNISDTLNEMKTSINDLRKEKSK